MMGVNRAINKQEGRKWKEIKKKVKESYCN